MKISFIIPAFNEEHYIGDCLTAIQTEVKKYKFEYEIIVVNNASTDGTKNVALSFPGVVVVDELKKGLSRARQSGFEASNGDLLATVDADTRMPAGWLGTVVQEFAKNEKLIALSGPQVFYDLPAAINFGIRLYYIAGYLGYILNRFILRAGSFLQGGNTIIRRSALLAIGGYNQSFEFYGEDADIAKRLHKMGPVKFTFKLPMYVSARRIKKEGLFTMMIRYPLNLIWTNIFGKPFTKTYTDIRPSQK